jgi:rhodanese-related sulfurtransferase
VAEDGKASSSGVLARMMWWLPVGRVPEQSPTEVARRLASPEPPRILDVRTPAEWRRSRIVGALNVPVQELRRRLPTLDLDPRRPVVVVCLSAHRSVPAVRLLKARGFRDAVQLAGGMNAWWGERLPVDEGD